VTMEYNGKEIPLRWKFGTGNMHRFVSDKIARSDQETKVKLIG
jgi:hypothetical protein